MIFKDLVVSWDGDKNIYPYPTYPKPPLFHEKTEWILHDVELGPFDLSDSRGRLDYKYWVLYKDENNDFLIAPQIGNTWGDATVLFNEPKDVYEMQLSFDQLGRPIVFYRVKGDGLYLFWFNPIIGTTEVRSFGFEGESIIAKFDVIAYASAPYSDVLLFYVRDNKIWMRVQRDRFDIEYDTGITGTELEILSTGLNVKNRFQVVYRKKDK